MSVSESPAAVAGGPAGAPLVVFVHGTRLSGAQWAAQLPVVGRRYRVLAVDLPGHGRLAGQPYSHDRAVAVISEAIAAEAGEGGTAVLVGHSLGGYVTVEFARQRPESVRGLVLAGCSAVPSGGWTVPYRLIARLAPRLPRELLNGVSDLAFRRYPPEVTGPVMAQRYFFEALPASWHSVFDSRPLPVLRRLDRPVLVLNGERDRVFRQHERAFARACRDARIELVPRAGHLVNFDEPEYFSAAVVRFLDGLDREGH